MFFNNLKIKSKLMIMGMVCVVVPIVALIVTAIILGSGTNEDAKDELQVLVEKDLDDITDGVLHMIQAQNEAVQQKVNADLNVARDQMLRAGKPRFGSGQMAWNAVNQYTKSANQIQLPEMLLGDARIQKNASFESETVVVDKVQKMVGGTCTIFQRMNEQGDMLRVATNVRKKDGSRAIGTYIPAVNPDGTQNPVVSTVLKGETFRGRAFVVDDWYITAYEPIKDASGKIIGVLYVGVKQENVQSLRKAIMNTKVGKTGYVYVLGGSGNIKGHYLISLNGARDGENIWEAKDSDGNLFIQDIVNKALALSEGEKATQLYPWKNAGDTEARMKVARIAYFEPWDWVIGVGAYQDDFTQINDRLDKGLASMIWWFVGIGLLLGLGGGFLSLVIGKAISRPLLDANNMLHEIAEGDGDLTSRLEVNTNDEIGELADAFNRFVEKLQNSIRVVADNTTTLNDTAGSLSSISTQLASSAEETTNQSQVVASAAEEISANVENVTKATEHMSENITTIATASEEMSSNVNTVATAIEEMTSSLQEVSKNCVRASAIAGDATENASSTNEIMGMLDVAAKEIGKVVEVINDIAEQTNLLALNATIEAASAGEAGKGFAVVANEVKELAKQTAQATEEITQQIEGIQGKTSNAVKAIQQISTVISEINTITNTIATAVEEQTSTTNEISRSVANAAEGAADVSKNVQNLSISIENEVVRAIREAASGINEVTKNTHGVNQAAEDTAKGAASTNEAATQTTILVQDLQQVVQQFRV